MIICKLSGGLGNQLFQYFNALSLKKRTGKNIYLDISSFDYVNDHNGYQLDKYGVDEPIIPNVLSKISYFFYRLIKKIFNISPSYYYLQNEFNFSKKEIKGSLVHVDGTFQSELFFSNVSCEAEKILDEPLDERCAVIKAQIQNSNSISLHVRRGDYVSNKTVSEVIGTCSYEYYQKSISRMEEKFPDCHFFVFTDDIEWVKTNLSFKSNFKYVDFNSGVRSHFDITLMRCCKHHIISNSSFSWMGAWRGDKTNTVICPSPWFNDTSINTDDVCPREWIKMKK